VKEAGELQKREGRIPSLEVTENISAAKEAPRGLRKGSIGGGTPTSLAKSIGSWVEKATTGHA